MLYPSMIVNVCLLVEDDPVGLTWDLLTSAASTPQIGNHVLITESASGSTGTASVEAEFALKGP